MSRRLILRSLGILLIVVLLVGGVVLAKLILPGKPGASRFVHFDGYVILPGDHFLNVLDYLSFWHNTLMVTSVSSGSVFEVNLRDALDGTPVIESVEGPPAAHGVAIATSTAMAFVTRSKVDTVDMFDPTSMQKLSSVNVADDADGIIYDPADDLLYVANGDAHVATLINPHGPAFIAKIPLGGAPEFPVFDQKTGLIFQNLNDINEVVVVDPRKQQVVDRWSISSCDGPTGLALDTGDRRLFAVCGRNSLLVVINITTHRVVASVPIGSGPDSVVYDAKYHRIYTAGIGGRLDIIKQQSPDVYVHLDSVKTHYGAHTLAVDPETHKIYVGYASLFVAPRLAVFTPTIKKLHLHKSD